MINGNILISKLMLFHDVVKSLELWFLGLSFVLLQRHSLYFEFCVNYIEISKIPKY